MIEEIKISDIASYQGYERTISPLSKINFFYGANGSGKTTISRAISEDISTPSCHLRWQGDRNLKAFVYNSDFVEKNFSQEGHFSGIFTLGESAIEADKQIELHRQELEKLYQEKERNQKTLDEKLSELSSIEEIFKERCWEAKNHYNNISEALHHRNSKEKFKERVLQEAHSNNSELKEMEELINKAKTLFSTKKDKLPILQKIDISRINAISEDPALQKSIVGKEDIEISNLIAKLNNSDWIKKGMEYLEETDTLCPFCQQKITSNLKSQLEDYFDEEFSLNIEKIKHIERQYNESTAGLINQIEHQLETESNILDKEKIRNHLGNISLTIEKNRAYLSDKISQPSKKITLDDLSAPISEINTIIARYNQEADQHNNMISNMEDEQEKLKSQTWKHLIEHQLKPHIEAYSNEKEKLNKSIEGLKKSIEEKNQRTNKEQSEIDKLESKSKSIQPSIKDMNSILRSYGFNGFTFSEGDTESSYMLIRDDGTPANKTLSEGEKTFVTFLYFYHLLKGSNTDSGLNSDRIVVIDDPISSLDSEILFIVSNMIKNLFSDMKNGKEKIKQIFILTHNIYFHKEITFEGGKDRTPAKDKTFWVVRKTNRGSSVEPHGTNPIQSSYEMLWSEIRNPRYDSPTIQNTMRRILETYFKILGGIDLHSIYKEFEGEDKLTCKTLLSWLNDGSHFAGEDLHVSVDEATIEKQLRIFREIFAKTNHEAHYKMMMKDN